MRPFFLPIFYSVILLTTFAQGFSKGLVLEDLEALVLMDNKTLKAKEALEKRALAQKRKSYAPWMPQVEGTYNIKKYEHPSTAAGDEQGTYSGSIKLTQKLFQLDLIYENKVEGFKFDIQKLLIDAERIKLLFDVRTAYFALSLQKELIEVQRRKIALLDETAGQVKERFDLGAATQFDVNQSRVYASNAEPAYYAFVRIWRHTQDKLLKLVGKSPKESIQVHAASLNVHCIPQFQKYENLLSSILKNRNKESLAKSPFSRLMDEWEQIALKYRPDIAILREQVSLTKNEIKKAKATYLPNISGFAEVASGETAKWNEQVWDWQCGIKIEVPIFEGMRRYQEAKGAMWQHKSAEKSLEAGLEQMEVELKDGLYHLEEAMASYFSAKGSYELARESLDQAKKKYELGFTILIDYKSVIDELFDAEVHYQKARFELLKAYYSLRLISGADLEHIRGNDGHTRR